jgi:hypothetical protein
MTLSIFSSVLLSAVFLAISLNVPVASAAFSGIGCAAAGFTIVHLIESFISLYDE